MTWLLVPRVCCQHSRTCASRLRCVLCWVCLLGGCKCWRDAGVDVASALALLLITRHVCTLLLLTSHALFSFWLGPVWKCLNAGMLQLCLMTSVSALCLLLLTVPANPPPPHTLTHTLHKPYNTPTTESHRQGLQLHHPLRQGVWTQQGAHSLTAGNRGGAPPPGRAKDEDTRWTAGGDRRGTGCELSVCGFLLP